MAAWPVETAWQRTQQLAKELLTHIVYCGDPFNTTIPLTTVYVSLLQAFDPIFSLCAVGTGLYSKYTTVYKGKTYTRSTLALRPSYALQRAVQAAVMVDYAPLVAEMVHGKKVFFDALGVEPSQFKPWMKPGDPHPPEFYDMVVSNDIK